MKFEDIGTKELIELNLHPIMHFKRLKQIFNQGYYIKPSNMNRGNFSDIMYASTSNKTREDDEKIQIKTFLEMTSEDFEKLYINGKALFKLLWLQKYLKGEVTGSYDVYQDESYKRLLELSELDRRDKEIHRLKLQLQEEKEKNKDLQCEIIELKKLIKQTERLRKNFLIFINESKDFFEKFKEELN